MCASAQCLFCSFFPVLHLLLHNSITVTGCILEFLPVQYSDASSCVGNQSCLLQDAGSQSHTGPARSQHLPQEFLREWQVG